MGFWHRLSLRTKFMVGMMLVLTLGLAASGTLLWSMMKQRAEWEVTNRGQLLLETMNAVRLYTNEHINPLLLPQLDTQPEFISEAIAPFSSREVFANLRQQEDFANFAYKEATENPTNPLDASDLFETHLLNDFRTQEGLTEQSGYRTVDGEMMFYSARPLTVTSEACLRCHSTPEAAPPSLINTYGSHGGFGWYVGDVVAAQIVYVPAGEVFEQARQSFVLVMAAFTAIYAAAALVAFSFLRRSVGKPLEGLAPLAQKIGGGVVRDEAIDDPAQGETMKRGDEIVRLAQAFNGTAHHIAEREAVLTREVQVLHRKVGGARCRQPFDASPERDNSQQDQPSVLCCED